ncbi:MAG: hypothetical protein V7637_4786 [Mycobacteriales bacterium]|jgi:uncharacterized membrane protein
MRGGRACAVVLVAALGAVTGLASEAVAQPGVVAPARACGWQLDTWLALPPGYTGAFVGATDGADRFVGTATNSAAVDDFRAVVWRAGQVVPLPAPAGSSSFAMGTNRRGDVVGVVFEAGGGFHGPNRPVLWRGGRMIELATPKGAAEASARDINDAGLIVGDSVDQAGEHQALVWSERAPARVRQVSAPGRLVSIPAVTENGVLAGMGVSTGEPATRTIAVAGTVAAGLRVLPDLHPGDFSSVFAANGSYLAGVALAPTGGGASAVLWHNAVPRALSTGPAEALAVNSHGAATGNRLSDFHPLVWDAGQERELPLVRSGQPLLSGLGQAITQDGRTIGGVVVTAADSPDDQPVLWHCR